MKKTAIVISIIALFISGLVYLKPQQDYQGYISDLISQYAQQSFGASVQPFAGHTYTLYGSGLSSSATSIILTSLTIPQTSQKIQDADLSDTFYLTIEPGNRTRQEIVSCTTVAQNSDGTATLSGCSRGLAPISPYTASTTLQFAHGGNTSAIFSDPPQLFNQYSALANNETISGLWTFNSYLPTSNITATTSNQFATKSYADNVIAGGSPTSTLLIGGKVELATQQEMASSTDASEVDKPRVLWSAYATSSPFEAGMWVPITDKNGLLNQSFLGLSRNFSWTGIQTWNTATSSFNAGLNIATTTQFGVYGGGLTPPGSIIAYASTTAPAGWILADGTSYPTGRYPNLFQVIGYSYGGSGANFSVPDLRNRKLVMASTTVNIGQTGGEANHTMTTAELVAHTHTIDFGSAGGGGIATQGITDAGDITTSSVGNTVPFNVLDPYMAMYFIIKY